MTNNVYSVYEEDGRIKQSNQVFGNEKYGDVLHERNMRFLQHGGEGHANLQKHWVDKNNLCERKPMLIILSKPRVKAGGIDAARITGIPRGAKITVSANNLTIFQQVQQGTSPFDISSVAPVIYTVRVHKWPYQDWVNQVEISA